ncbi:MAG: hypothetical protein MK212_05660 [Saprospiraceae bacterium]|nr:hypothetical protein [Saprospiraceae bacterium]
MLTYEEAERIALIHINDGNTNDEYALNGSGFEFKYGWIFFYNPKSLFHPKLKEIDEKVEKLLEEGKQESHIWNKLTSDEKIIYKGGIASAGGPLPFFIDKETGEIIYKQPPLEAIVQEIIEAKTNTKFYWHIIIKKDKDLLKKLSELKRWCSVPNSLEWIKKYKTQKPVFTTSSIRECIRYKKALQIANLEFHVEKVEKNDT